MIFVIILVATWHELTKFSILHRPLANEQWCLLIYYQYSALYDAQLRGRELFWKGEKERANIFTISGQATTSAYHDSWYMPLYRMMSAGGAFLFSCRRLRGSAQFQDHQVDVSTSTDSACTPGFTIGAIKASAERFFSRSRESTKGGHLRGQEEDTYGIGCSLIL